MKRLLLALLLASPLAFVPLYAGCNSQGEGQLCSTLNNNDDCVVGLTCTAVPGTGASVCCSVGSTNTACIGTVNATSSTGGLTTSSSSGGGGAGGAGGGGGAGGTGGTGGTPGTGGSASDAGTD